MAEALSEPAGRARDLFAPLGPTYDRYARLLSFGQDPRWRALLASHVTVGQDATVLDVATGTGAVAIAIARATGCRVVGLDQSPEMLAEARRRIEAAGLAGRIELVEAGAERLPFDDGTFDGLSFTYLLRYVADPLSALRELARVVRPGGPVATLEFAVPRGAIRRPLWDLYVDRLLPAAGRLISPGWHEVGRFLGPSIRDLERRCPPERQAELWEEAGIEVGGLRRTSLGGGVVIWGRRR